MIEMRASQEVLRVELLKTREEATTLIRG